MNCLPMLRALSVSSMTALIAFTANAEDQSVIIGERPTVENHMSQDDIDQGDVRLRKIIKHGHKVFDARFNILDGRGRPGTTGGGAPRDPHGQPEFLRTSGPDANACAGCHNQPSSGGAGEFVANVFVLAQTLDPVTDSVSPEFSNERNTLGMFGAGPIEMLAREMSDDLIAIREQAKQEAASEGVDITKPLITKGVSFGYVTVTPEGLVDPTQIDGVDWDLVVKPFHQKGAVVSLREFTNNAMNHHHGIQTTERFGVDVDADQDGVYNELTTGDVTAVTVYQATLPPPSQKYPKNKQRKMAAKEGKAIFAEVGCNSCHKEQLTLNSRYFSEPNPYNPIGNLQADEVMKPLKWDMARFTEPRSLVKTRGDRMIVKAFTDLKRHNLCDADYQHFCNEQLHQGSLVGFANESDFTVPAEPRPTEEFLTRKLWDVANSDPYGHRGDLTTITEAVHFHGGDARAQRDEYFALPQEDQDKVVEFLKTLGVF